MTARDAVALEVSGLEVRAGRVPIVRGIDFSLKAGRRLGIVGESGSGKTLTALAVMRLHRAPIRVTGGSVLLGGLDLLTLSRRQLDRIRGARISMIYQDPGSSLNPLLTVGAQIAEAIRLHERVPKAAALERAADLLGEVGVPSPARRLGAYPHEFSGGMRQRVMIAMALAGNPEVMLCDEPTTALDVTTQARVLGLMDRVCAERGVAVVLITHDLGVAAGFCDDIAVMYAGRVMEHAPVRELFGSPRHPYSTALMSATIDLAAEPGVPIPAIAGQPPLPADVDDGCAFRARCPHAEDRCARPVPATGPFRVRCIREEPS